MMTVWGDDGHECFFDYNWAGLALYLAWCRKENPSDNDWQRRTELVSGLPYKAYELFSSITSPLKVMENIMAPPGSYLSKPLFYDDPLLGTCNMLFDDNSPYEVYADIKEQLSLVNAKSEPGKLLLKLAEDFSNIISLKYLITRSAKIAYKTKSIPELKKLLDTIPEIRKSLKRFHENYRKMWFLRCYDAQAPGLHALGDRQPPF